MGVVSHSLKIAWSWPSILDFSMVLVVSSPGQPALDSTNC